MYLSTGIYRFIFQPPAEPTDIRNQFLPLCCQWGTSAIGNSHQITERTAHIFLPLTLMSNGLEVQTGHPAGGTRLENDLCGRNIRKNQQPPFKRMIGYSPHCSLWGPVTCKNTAKFVSVSRFTEFQNHPLY